MLRSKWFWFGIIATIVIVYLGFVFNNYNNIKQELEYANNNILAYVNENNKLKDKNIEYQFTVDQLNYLNDSIIQQMNEVRKELGIKDKKLKSLQYQLTLAHKTDSIFLHDTIFRDPTFSLDTAISDDWYCLDLNLSYPSTIVVSPTFKSEKYIVSSYSKEYVGEPKKCFIARWFQRKQTVVTIDVIEKSPYIETQQTRFIEIVK